MADAVLRANRRATPGDVVLMSPGCTSFDMFQNAEERGQVFAQAVLKMQTGQVSGGSRG